MKKLKLIAIFGAFIFFFCCTTRDTKSENEFDEPVLVKNIEFVRIKKGSFYMGSSSDDDIGLYVRPGPVHLVNIEEFEIMRTEVTVEMFKECVIDGGCNISGYEKRGSACNFLIEGRERHPMNCVSWNEIKEFIDWFGHDVRLPSEAEWEYVARNGGKDQEYPWGSSEASCEYANIIGCNTSTVPVSSIEADSTGFNPKIFDMGGNVSEFTQDDFHGSYDCTKDRTPLCKDGVAPSDGSPWISEYDNPNKLIRSGSWKSDPLKTTDRGTGVKKDEYFESAGFRLARDID